MLTYIIGEVKALMLTSLQNHRDDTVYFQNYDTCKTGMLQIDSHRDNTVYFQNYNTYNTGILKIDSHLENTVYFTIPVGG